jgi:hypothetical protein
MGAANNERPSYMVAIQIPGADPAFAHSVMANTLGNWDLG